jgi:uncharacterized membrane protein
MNTPNSTLAQMARESLSGKWGLAVLATLVYLIVITGVQLLNEIDSFLAIVSIIIAGPMALGYTSFSLNISRNKEAMVEDVFSGFQNFGTSLGAYLLMLIFILLWSLLLIIPGIIAALSYSMTFYILADDPSIKPMDAIDKSKAMMQGNKWKYFLLNLRFIGWAILCLFTFGIGFLWLIPYIQISVAKFYDDIKQS